MRLFLIMTSRIKFTKTTDENRLYFRNSRKGLMVLYYGARAFASTAYVAHTIMKETPEAEHHYQGRKPIHNCPERVSGKMA